jgi:5-formyltetrahydrofolate cyclo-ligase
VNKAALRTHYRQQRRALSDEERQTAEQQIVTVIQANPSFLAAQHIGVYLAFDGEANLQTLIQYAWQQGKTLYLPQLASQQQLCFVHYTAKTTLLKSSHGTLEPHGGDATPAHALDLLLIPLLAFHPQGHRLGMGAGCYDRTLMHTGDKPVRMGIGFACQQCDTLQADPWDIPLHHIITENTPSPDLVPSA